MKSFQGPLSIFRAIFFPVVLSVFISTYQSVWAERIQESSADDQNVIEIVKPPLKGDFGDGIAEIAVRFRVESFFGKGLELFQQDPRDQILIPAKHTIDTGFAYALGKKKLGYELFRIKSTIRTRGTWGAPESILSTASSTIKDTDAVFGLHNHTINRFVLWMRELWMQVALGGLFGGDQSHNTTFTLGIFPFELGRGIALGSAYAKDPDILGYSPATAIDQFAPGFRLSGDFIKNRVLSYDLYAAVLNNKSDSFKNVNLATQSQQFGERCHPERGFGVINYLLAGRLQYRPFQDKCFSLSLEPYWLYERQKEQRIEFVGDADMHLGTIGLAWNMDWNGFILDFEIAQNIGVQNVYGWDRNSITKENRDGISYYVNSDVIAIATQGNDTAGKKAVASKANISIIDSAPENQAFNGQQIGTSNLKNSASRFSNPYQNWLHGTMFVGDIAYRWNKNFRIALEAAVATGDAHPNRDFIELGDSNRNGKFRGFVSLQEAYSGHLVKSAFLLNGSGNVPRISNFASPATSDATASVITKFTNIIYVGMSAEIKGELVDKPWTFMPNIISYWQEHPLFLFDRDTNTGELTPHKARSWYGIEMNVSSDIMLTQDCKFFFIGAVFLPGTYYSDIAGRPITKELQTALEQKERDGASKKEVLFSSTFPAFFMNTGIEYRF